MTEEQGWIKDKTPFLIFKCSKCKQYIYVKTTNKTKKCIRCGKTYKVINLKKKGEMVYGLSNAIKMVKDRQNEIGVKEFGNVLEFNSFHEFKIRKPQKESITHYSYKEHTTDLSSSFIEMLDEIQKQYSKFPLYVITLKAEDYGIPKEELKILINSFLLKGFLIKTKNGLFSIKK